MLLALTILLSLLGLGVLIALIVNLATFALPLYVAALAGRFAFETGAGYLGAFLVGAAAGGVALGIGQIAFAAVRWWPARVVIALLFAVPAAVAGYSVVHGLSGIGIEAESWRRAFALSAAVATGFAALARLAGPTAPAVATHIPAGSRAH
jgi:hypothetical protein